MVDNTRQLVYEPNLRALRQEFKRCSETYPPLYHDRLIAWSSEGQVSISDEAWDMFIEANPEPEDSDEGWWAWDRTRRDPEIGRFWGSPDGLPEFVKLAESAATVFRKMKIDLDGTGCNAWLSLLHDLAFRSQILLLRSSLHLWGIEDERYNEFDELVEEWHCSDDGARLFPLHPCHWVMAHNVFTSSMAAIDAALSPSSILSTEDVLDPAFAAKLFADTEAEGETKLEETAAPPTCLFKQELKGVWHLRFVEDGKVVEEKRFSTRRNEGFVICQQILTSVLINNDKLGSKQTPAGMVQRRTESGETLIVDLKEICGISESDDELYVEGERKIPMITDEAIQKVQAQLQLLESQRDQAHRMRNEDKTKSLQQSIDRHKQFMSAYIDIDGKPRNYAAGSRDEQDRSRVSKALGECMEVLRTEKLFGLASFLEVNLATVWKGRVYLRAADVKWET